MKGVTLLELLRFYAEEYVHLVKELQELEIELRFDRAETGTDDDIPLSKERAERAKVLLHDTKARCEKIGLQVCIKHAEELIQAVSRKYLLPEQVVALHENVERELSCHFFVGVAENRKSFFCESLKDWGEITGKFQAATEDVEEMNKCFALCRYSAAVFHSLIIVEHGLVALGKLLPVTDPKEGWDASCKVLEAIVKAGYPANKTGLSFEFLEQLNACVQAMKFAWRNRVNHATGKPIVMGGGFAPYVAEDIIAATRAFMRRLAEGIP